jgi:hypothetical protein
MLLALAGLCTFPAQSAEPQSAEPVSLTLACQGTVTTHVYGGSEYDPELVSMGLIVNFTNHTVKGTARWAPFLFDDEIPIIHSNQDTITFRGLSEFLGMKIHGSVDRVTGNVTMQALGDKWNYSYALKCKPTQRMF